MQSKLPRKPKFFGPQDGTFQPCVVLLALGELTHSYNKIPISADEKKKHLCYGGSTSDGEKTSGISYVG